MLQALAGGLRQDRHSRAIGYLDGLAGASFDIRVLRGERAIDAFAYANGFSEGRRERLRTKRDVDVAA
jgi:hypothetical protein